jgi:hypothetical protein
MPWTEKTGPDHESAPPPIPSGQKAAETRGQLQVEPRPHLKILLVAGDDEAAAQATALLGQTYGERCRCDRLNGSAGDPDRIRNDEYDVLLIAESPEGGDVAELVGSSMKQGCRQPIIVLAGSSDRDLDLRVVEAGAMDCIPMADLTPALLERSIRHALVHEHLVARARGEIESLSVEIGRLNMLRDAGHRFVDNACHDFRSPLTVIKEFSSIIADGLAGDVNEEQAEFLGIVLTRVDQLSHMVDSILDASRLESDLISVQREQHSPAALVEQSRPTLEQQASDHGAQLHISIPDSLPNVFADAESVGRIISNLATNACKFAGDSGRIEIWTRHEPGAGAVTFGVTDNGPGIAPEHVKVIFDRFRQIESDTERAKKGFGLGLHIASELVRVNFGTLSVESEPNKGSTFSFTLPVFDVDVLLPLHFSFLKTSRHNFQDVSIAIAALARDTGPDVRAETERFLTRQFRSYDLLLRVSETTWLACFACNESDLSDVTGRIQRAYAEHNINRPKGRLPDISFRPIGTWTLSKRPEELTDAIRGAYGLGRTPEGVH